jgi:DNA-binding PadR family transcriptional regulator
VARAGGRCFTAIVADQPLCSVVLSLLATGPRRPHEVASAVGSSFGMARVALERLRAAGLVRSRHGGRFAITARGRSELALQRALWALAARPFASEPSLLTAQCTGANRPLRG